MELRADDLADLVDAVEVLENPGLAAKLSNLIGKPIEAGVKRLPKRWAETINSTTTVALRTALRTAVGTMNSDRGAKSSNRMHKVLATASGLVGGAFGLPALAIELPVSTTIMLRSMADIARAEGEDIRDSETQLACLETFALGSHSKADDGAETGYYPTRAALAGAVSEAAKFIAERGLAEEGAPVLVRLISKISARFSIPISEKLAAQSIPAIGAAGGAAVNLIFIIHFQDVARGHFTIRRLEREYGSTFIQNEYDRIKRGFK